MAVPPCGIVVHVQRLHALLKRRVVNRQRTFQKRVAGERDQPHPVRPGLLHQFQRGEFGARQPVRRDVGCQHALGSVHRHHDVQSALLDLLQIKSMLRPGQRDHQQCHREHQASEPDFLPRGGNADGQLRQQPRLDELHQQLLPRAHRPPEKCEQRRRNHQQQPENFWMLKAHVKNLGCSFGATASWTAAALCRFLTAKYAMPKRQSAGALQNLAVFQSAIRHGSLRKTV